MVLLPPAHDTLEVEGVPLKSKRIGPANATLVNDAEATSVSTERVVLRAPMVFLSSRDGSSPPGMSNGRNICGVTARSIGGRLILKKRARLFSRVGYLLGRQILCKKGY
jgi:hypothetical protein